MIQGKKILAIIPARAGSKRLPKKNLLNLCGKPLILWTMEAAKKSKFIDKIIVSSDDKEIVKLSKIFGTDAILRPSELATDEAKTIDVVKHVIEILEEKNDYIILLQPTSPLRTEKHIDQAFELLLSKNADAIISVCPVEHPLQWCNYLPEDLNMSNFISSEVKNSRSQDLPVYYRINGAIYICKIDRLIKEGTFFIKDKIFAYIMKKEDSVDIDDIFDFKIAELILMENANKKNI